MTNTKDYSVEDEEDWLEGIKKAVNRHLFDHVQFICDDESEQYGSGWQKQICKRTRISDAGEDVTETFWNNKGMAEARRVLNRRRQNTNTAMKRVFLGEFATGRHDVGGQVY
jgi:hypothetical protein